MSSRDMNAMIGDLLFRDWVKAKLDSGELTFDGAKKRHYLPPGAFGILSKLGIEVAEETGQPRAACITKACSAYWRLYDERK